MYDVLVIGGGINGAGLARDASGRGLKVLLCERDDLASHTSSASTKLIHGGLRYLEYYDFALVRKALMEREVLLRSAPHIIWPLRFVLPHQKGLRPAWLVRLGLFLYDHLGGRKILPATKVLRRAKSDKLTPLKSEFKMAFEYSDCWVEDSRLVALNAVDAKERGARILTRRECVKLTRHADHWTAALKDPSGQVTQVEAKTVVNAAGPWVADVLNQSGKNESRESVRLVKGSHIIVPRKYEGPHAYFFQNGDGRIMFAIPYESGQFTLVGTTDLAFDGKRDNVNISEDEINYLIEASNEYFETPITRDDVISHYSGIRPLFEDHAQDASSVTRDYVLSALPDEGPAMISVFGGKITTYRKLSEDVLLQLEESFPKMGKPWTKDSILPGGDIAGADFEAFVALQIKKYPRQDKAVIRRLARAYGTRMDIILNAPPGRIYGKGLSDAELAYLVEAEFCMTAQDVLWRRSKLGLHLTPEQIKVVEARMSELIAASPKAFELPKSAAFF